MARYDEMEFIGWRATFTLLGLCALGLVPLAVVAILAADQPWLVFIAASVCLVPAWIFGRRHPEWP